MLCSLYYWSLWRGQQLKNARKCVNCTRHIMGLLVWSVWSTAHTSPFACLLKEEWITMTARTITPSSCKLWSMKTGVSWICRLGGRAGCTTHTCLTSQISPSLATALCGDDYIFGNTAYPDLPFLLTPFEDNSHLTVVQRKYNITHARIRILVVEQVVGLLENRLTRLKKIDQRDIEAVVTTVMFITGNVRSTRPD